MILCARHFIPIFFIVIRYISPSASISIYIVGSKIATTFHRVTFQFYPHFTQPVALQPQEKSVLPTVISHFSVNATWTREISFMKYEARCARPVSHVIDENRQLRRRTSL